LKTWAFFPLVVVKEGIGKDEAEAIQKKLEKAGGKVTVEYREQLKTPPPPPEQAEEKTEFDVILKEVPDDKKTAVINAVRDLIPELGLAGAKALVEAVPTPVKEGIGKDEAEAIRKKLEEAGGKVTVK
jgi:ribosomal protein L7/L12